MVQQDSAVTRRPDDEALWNFIEIHTLNSGIRHGDVPGAFCEQNRVVRVVKVMFDVR